MKRQPKIKIKQSKQREPKSKSTSNLKLLGLAGAAGLLYILISRSAKASTQGSQGSVGPQGPQGPPTSSESYTIRMNSKGETVADPNTYSSLLPYKNINSATVFNNVISSLSNGGKISIGDGIFNLSGPINLINGSGIILQGTGQNTILKPTSSISALNLNNQSRTVIRDIAFQNQVDSDQNTIGINLDNNSQDIYIENCYFDKLGLGIKSNYDPSTNKGVYRLTISNSIIRDCLTGGITTIGTPDLHLINNMLRYNANPNNPNNNSGNVEGDAINIQPGPTGAESGGHYIIGNYISRSGSNAINANSIFSMLIHSNVIDQNIRGFHLDNVYDIEINGNTIATNDSSELTNNTNHIEIVSSANKSHNVTIGNNDIRNPINNAIFLNNINGFTITGNTIRGRYTNAEAKRGLGSGIRCEQCIDGTISGNRIGGEFNQGGFYLDGIYLTGTNNSSISSNRVSNCRYGIYEDVTSDRNVYVSNVLTNNFTGAYLTQGTNRKYANNIDV